MDQAVGLAVLSSCDETEKVTIVVSRPDSDNILTLNAKKGTIIQRMQDDQSFSQLSILLCHGPRMCF